jgi:polysaccharide export outer membrane protein
MRFCQAKWLSVNRVGAALIAFFLVFGGSFARAQEKPPEIPPDPQGAIQELPPDKAAIPQTKAAVPQTPESNPKPENIDDKNSTSSAKKPDKNGRTPDAGTQDIMLGAGDLVSVSVYGVPELTTKARVSNDGNLYLPLIDNVHVADLGLEEAQKLIEKRLDDGGFVRNPHVTVFVDEYSSQGVTLLGDVARPGIYPVLGDRRLFDLISYAGGLTDRASRTVVITHRSQPDKTETIHLARNLLDDTDGNVSIHPGDTVEVRRAPIVYIVGDVGRPSGLLIDNGSLSVLQAVALVGGPNRTAKLNGTRIIRKGNGPNGMSETVVPLKKMLRAQAPDVQLKADDILFIPVSGARAAATRGIETAIALTTAVSIYAIHP